MSFLFVDNIIELTPGKHATGIKHVTPSERYLTKDQQGKLVLMAPVIGEALGQLTGWCIMKAVNFAKRPIAGIVNKVNIYGDAYLGDTIHLETFVDRLDDEAVAYHSVASVAGKEIFVIESALGPMLPMAEFIDEDTVKRQFSQICRTDNSFSIAKGQVYLNADTVPICRDAFYDQIIEWNANGRVIVQKKVSITAPYLIQHFPRKPVLPLTILLICNLDLAYKYLSQHLTPEELQAFNVRRLLRVKMNKFVQPGSTLTTTMVVKQPDKQRYRFRFQSKLGQTKVCITEIEFACH